MYDRTKHLTMVEGLSEKGATRAEIALRLKIARSTLHLLMTERPELSDAFARGQEAVADLVERSLLERATGYTCKEEHIFVVSQGQGKPAKVERHSVNVHIPPDVTAITFFLTNRRKHRWVDQPKSEHAGKITLEQLLAGSWEKDDVMTDVRPHDAV